MGKRRWSSRFAWLRHWRGVVQVLCRLGLCAIVVGLVFQLIRWVGPPATAEPVGDEVAEIPEAYRVALKEVARFVKLGLIILGGVVLIVLLAVFYSRRPVTWERRWEPAQRSRKEGGKGGRSEDSEHSSHTVIHIDPDTLEDFTSDS